MEYLHVSQVTMSGALGITNISMNLAGGQIGGGGGGGGAAG